MRSHLRAVTRVHWRTLAATHLHLRSRARNCAWQKTAHLPPHIPPLTARTAHTSLTSHFCYFWLLLANLPRLLFTTARAWRSAGLRDANVLSLRRTALRAGCRAGDASAFGGGTAWRQASDYSRQRRAGCAAALPRTMRGCLLGRNGTMSSATAGIRRLKHLRATCAHATLYAPYRLGVARHAA